MEDKWSNLPKDILDVIVKCLNNSSEIDVLLLRLCSIWRSSLPLSKISPFEVSCLDKIADLSTSESKFPPYAVKLRTTLLIAPPESYANTVALSSTLSWIIQVVETSPKKLSLIDPFSYRSEDCFPKCIELPDHINLANYKIKVIDQSHFLDFGEASESNWKTEMVDDAIVETNEDFVLFIHQVPGTLAYRKSGMREWAPIIKGMGHSGSSWMVRHKNKIYAYDYCGLFKVIDVVTCEVVRSISFPHPICWEKCHCLGVFNGQLYLVTYRQWYETAYIEDMRVYVLDEDNATWEPKPDLGGGVFFVRRYTLMICVSAKDLGLPNGDCIYFFGYKCYNDEVGSVDQCTIVYDLHACKSFVHNWGPNRAPFWPPPHWIKEIEEGPVACDQVG